MPARMINGEAMWSSEKIAACATEMPATSGVYYPWLYPLADANGVFEMTSIRVIHGLIATQLPFLTVENLLKILEDFHRNGLLFVWEKNGKRYGFWTNSDQPGRLPKPSDRHKYKNVQISIPTEKLKKYLSLIIERSSGDEGAITSPMVRSRFDVGLNRVEGGLKLIGEGEGRDAEVSSSTALAPTPQGYKYSFDQEPETEPKTRQPGRGELYRRALDAKWSAEKALADPRLPTEQRCLAEQILTQSVADIETYKPTPGFNRGGS